MARLYFSFMHKRNLAHLQDFLDELPFAGTKMTVGARHLRHHEREGAFLLSSHAFQGLVGFGGQLITGDGDEVLRSKA